MSRCTWHRTQRQEAGQLLASWCHQAHMVKTYIILSPLVWDIWELHLGQAGSHATCCAQSDLCRYYLYHGAARSLQCHSLRRDFSKPWRPGQRCIYAKSSLPRACSTPSMV